MSVKKPLATISAIVLIIVFLSNYVPLLPVFCDGIWKDNQTVGLGYCPHNHQKNFNVKPNNKPKEQFCCCTMQLQFLAEIPRHPDNPHGTFQEIQSNFYNLINHNKSSDIREMDKFGSLDRPLYLSYQVLLI